MKNILILVFVFALIGCNSDKNKSSDDIKNSHLHHIELLNRKMYLPKDYEKSSAGAIAELLMTSTERDEFTDYELHRLNNFRKMGPSIEIFVDRDDYENVISFHPGHYIKMSKDALEVYVDLLENNLFLESEAQGIEYERLESKFLDYGLAEIVKVKYLQTINEHTRYLTQYLVSHNLKAFAIIVIHKENKDFQYILNGFKI